MPVADSLLGMRSRSHHQSGGFTLIELLCVVAIIGILAALLLPAVNRAQMQGRRIDCAAHLKEIGVGFHLFAHDHKGLFPMQVPQNEGGSLEYFHSGYQVSEPFYFSYFHFRALSNELGNARLLVCPADLRREPALNFIALRNNHLSYFVGVFADMNRPTSILSGDRNLTNDVRTPWAASLLQAAAGTNNLRWTEEMHQFKGNLLFADGHVEQVRDPQLAFANSAQAGVPSDLFLPTVASSDGSGPPPSSPPSGPGSGSGSGSAGPSPSGNNSGRPEGATPPSPPTPPGAPGPMGSGSSSASSRGGFQQNQTVPPAVPMAREKPSTNPPVSLSGYAPPEPEPEPLQLFLAEIGEVAAKASWLLLFILLLLLALLIASRLRERQRKKLRFSK